MRRKSQLVMLCVLAVMAGLVILNGKVSYGKLSAAKGAIIEWRITNAMDDFRGEPMPVMVIQITKDGKAIKFGEAFAAPAEALANASVTLRNVSDKEIKDMSLALMLVDPQTNRPKSISLPVKFNGKIAANGEATGIIDSQIIKGLQHQSEYTGLPLTQLRLGVNWVEFADSTRWMYGTIFLPDPQKPGNWYVKGAYDVYTKLLKQRKEDVEYRKVGAQAYPCYYPGLVQQVPCISDADPEQSCSSTLIEHFTSFPTGSIRYNFDFVYVECAPGCHTTTLRIVGAC